MLARYRLPCILIITALAVGCSTKQESSETAGDSHANQPTTFQQAVEELVQQRNTIRDGFASGNVDAAHGPLHEVGHTLELLVKLAEKKGIQGSDLETVKQSTETLFDAFDNVDKTLHGGEGSTYEDEAETIDKALGSIAAIAGVADNSPAAGVDNGPPAGGDVETTDAPAPGQ